MKISTTENEWKIHILYYIVYYYTLYINMLKGKHIVFNLQFLKLKWNHTCRSSSKL